MGGSGPCSCSASAAAAEAAGCSARCPARTSREASHVATTCAVQQVPPASQPRSRGVLCRGAHASSNDRRLCQHARLIFFGATCEAYGRPTIIGDAAQAQHPLHSEHDGCF